MWLSDFVNQCHCADRIGLHSVPLPLLINQTKINKRQGPSAIEPTQN